MISLMLLLAISIFRLSKTHQGKVPDYLKIQPKENQLKKKKNTFPEKPVDQSTVCFRTPGTKRRSLPKNSHAVIKKNTLLSSLRNGKNEIEPSKSSCKEMKGPKVYLVIFRIYSLLKAPSLNKNSSQRSHGLDIS